LGRSGGAINKIQIFTLSAILCDDGEYYNQDRYGPNEGNDSDELFFLRGAAGTSAATAATAASTAAA
jgi:hypothetical protein